MNAARWRRLQALLDEALDRPATSREAYLREASGADTQLLDDALRLLRAADRAGHASSLLAGTAADFARPLLEELDERDARRRSEERSRAREIVRRALAGRYDLRGELGHGGMAAVYRADDPRHGREVAVKVLDGAGHADAQLFLREIGITARLTHPHVLPIHDSGECDGVLYYVMPFVSGETLRARLVREHRLPVEDSLRLLREIADALAHAHESGIVHRDLKPENILLSGEHAVVADFGIARALESAARPPAAATSWQDGRATQLWGTPAYMAPEQLHGDVDHRADLFALGIIAFEMLTGTHPFASSDRVPFPVLRGDAALPPLRELRPDAPPGIEALAAALLAYDPAARIQDARTVVRQLDAFGRGAPAADSPRPRRRRAWLGAAAASALLVMAVAAAFVSRVDAPAFRSDDPAVRVAVLPFEFRGDDTGEQYLGEALADELALTLARLPGVRVTGRATSRSVDAAGATPPEIGRMLNVSVIVTGAVHRANGRMRVTARLLSTSDGAIIGQHVYESTADDVFALQDEITTALAAALAGQIGARDPGRTVATERGTTDQEAYDLYLQGRYLMVSRGADNVRRAVTFFEKAIERDPRFARAYADLANAHTILPSYIEADPDSVTALITDNALRAISLDSTLADARVALGTVFDRRLNFAEAVRQFRAAVAAEPSNVIAHHWLGTQLLTMGRTEEAIETLRRGVQIDPLAKSLGSAYAGALATARRYDEAIAEAQRVLAIDSTFPIALGVLAHTYIFAGRAAEAVDLLEHGATRYPEVAGTPGLLMVAYAAAGRSDDFEALAASPRATTGRAAATNRVIAEMVRGNIEPAVALLTTRAGLLEWYDVRIWGGCNQLLDPLWGDVRFRRAMEELGVQPCTLVRPWPVPPRAGSGLSRQ